MDASMLTALASEAAANVRIPAGERDGPVPLRRSRSAPINRPIPSAIAKLTIAEYDAAAILVSCQASLSPRGEANLRGHRQFRPRSPQGPVPILANPGDQSLFDPSQLQSHINGHTT
jgi:hypothetical protein